MQLTVGDSVGILEPLVDDGIELLELPAVGVAVDHELVQAFEQGGVGGAVGGAGMFEGVHRYCSLRACSPVS
jgi:hypothetical protein